ncbi:MAG: serine/threonine protein kinase [Polyangiaceae bacterium]|nr:serine/threonine protein kinase [Polyangiaceae bacterium]
MLAARSGRAERLRKSVRGAHERREAVRRLVLAVDATPAGAEPEPAAPASAKSILTRVRALIASNHDAMMDRPLARAFAVCIERAVPEAASVETLGLILAFRNEAFRKYSAEFAGGKLVLAAKALLQVRASVDRTLKALGTAEDRHPRPGARGKRRLARELLPSLRDLSKKVGLLGDGPIVRGLDDLVGVAVHLLHQRRPSAALAGVVADAIETLSTGMREAAAAVGAPSPRGPSVAALQRRVEELVARPTSRAGLEAKREIERVLPPILGGLLDVIFALQGALDTEAEPPPPVIGDYQVVKALGAGGMGSCLLVRSRSRDDDRTYVLKVPQRTSGHYRTWFRREALALLSLADAPHRGIVRFVSFHDGLGGRPHLVMEWVDGESLEAHISKQALPIGEAIGVVADLASAVAHAHARGIGHYDIKPANVVLHMASIPVLVDWGIAGATCQSRVGTPYYMAPERLRPDDNDWPLASDIFSLACVLCEIVGKTRLLEPTWSDADESVDKGFMERLASIDLPRGHDQLVLARLHENRKVLAERARRMLGPCPDRVVSLVLEMLDPNPARRPSAAYVERALRAYC